MCVYLCVCVCVHVCVCVCVYVCVCAVCQSQCCIMRMCLYPQYPAYLSENEGKLEASDLELYRKQYDLMTSICSVYEEEQPNDTASVKSERFEKLLDLMQQVCTVDNFLGTGRRGLLRECMCVCVCVCVCVWNMCRFVWLRTLLVNLLSCVLCC